MNYTNPYQPSQYSRHYKLPTVSPYSQRLQDCPEGTVRINNYFKECWGPVYVCRDACYDYYLDHYEGIGPWKSCGICIGGA